MPKEIHKFKAIDIADLAFPPREGGYVRGHEAREKILRSALRILVEDGYCAMSMRRVAAESDMKMGNLTYHFPSREGLVRDLLDAVTRSYEIEFDAIASTTGAPPEQRLADLCRLILEDLRTKKTTRLFPELWALSNHDSYVLERVQEMYKRARRPLHEFILEMRPDLSEATRQDIALFISASMEGMTVFVGHDKPFEPRLPSLEVIAIQAFIDIVRNFHEAVAPALPDTEQVRCPAPSVGLSKG